MHPLIYIRPLLSDRTKAYIEKSSSPRQSRLTDRQIDSIAGESRASHSRFASLRKPIADIGKWHRSAKWSRQRHTLSEKRQVELAIARVAPPVRRHGEIRGRLVRRHAARADRRQRRQTLALAVRHAQFQTEH